MFKESKQKIGVEVGAEERLDWRIPLGEDCTLRIHVSAGFRWVYGYTNLHNRSLALARGLLVLHCSRVLLSPPSSMLSIPEQAPHHNSSMCPVTRR